MTRSLRIQKVESTWNTIYVELRNSGFALGSKGTCCDKSITNTVMRVSRFRVLGLRACDVFRNP
jgi:hypothetical protein